MHTHAVAAPLLSGLPLAWADVAPRLHTARPGWLTAVRANADPCTRPVLAVWASGAVHVAKPPRSVKAQAVRRRSRHSALTRPDTTLTAGGATA